MYPFVYLYINIKISVHFLFILFIIKNLCKYICVKNGEVKWIKYHQCDTIERKFLERIESMTERHKLGICSVASHNERLFILPLSYKRSVLIVSIFLFLSFFSLFLFLFLSSISLEFAVYVCKCKYVIIE